MSSTVTAERTDRELIDSLRAFPNRVLPAGVLRELMSRGPAIQDELLRPLRMAADNAGKGIGSLPQECFYCFGLLLAHPGVHQLPTLEALLRLDGDDLDETLGDLAYKGTLALLVGIAKADGVEETLAWIDRMIEDDSIDAQSRWSILPALPYLVREGMLERFAATDRLIGVLRRRESCKQDLLSAASVVELSNLGATEFESYVIDCFERGQIDEDLYARDDWDRESEEGTTPQARLEALPELQFDIIQILESWHGFSKISNSLDPWNATYEPNASSDWGWTGSSLSDAEIEDYIESIRKSNDSVFPRAAVEALSRHAGQAEEQLIEEVRRGMGEVGGPEARSSNGPFLALTILIARQIRLPSDLLLDILDLSDDQRMDLFGDAMDTALVIALSLSLLGDTRPIDQRIADPQRPELDRETLALFYPLSAWHGFLPRREAIDRLIGFWREAQEDESSVSASLFEALCVMSPEDHRASLMQTLEQGMCGRNFDQGALRAMLENPSLGEERIQELARECCDVMKQIETSVMFDQSALHPQRVQPSVNVHRESPRLASTATVRKTESGPRRNDACPCGSGKKYKKCCMRQ